MSFTPVANPGYAMYGQSLNPQPVNVQSVSPSGGLAQSTMMGRSLYGQLAQPAVSPYGQSMANPSLGQPMVQPLGQSGIYGAPSYASPNLNMSLSPYGQQVSPSLAQTGVVGSNLYGPGYSTATMGNYNPYQMAQTSMKLYCSILIFR